MSNETTVYVNTVYWEGGETYRPVVTVKTPKQWPTKRMAFYKSTGSSNTDTNNEYRKGTWFPTLGLLQEDSTLFLDLNKGEDGYILKRNVFSKIFNISIANWDRAILTEMEFNVKYNIYRKIPEYLKTNMSPTKKIEEEVKKIEKFCGVIVKYCNYWWQVQISAQLGEGYWENVPEFRNFVLMHDYDDYYDNPTINYNYIFEERSSPLPVLNIKYNVDKNTQDNAVRVMDVLNNKDAILEKLLYGNYREHKQSLLNIFKKGLSLSKQRKSNSKSLSETKDKEPPTKKIKRSLSETKEKEPSTKKIKRSPPKTRNTRSRRKI